ncbi:hypothetical protein ART_3386 [Arthrobacter sp. PAMC 25486]|nr:hypothetical protein ART_3386 [Arthrobacter sp. PAMC 25486]
MVDEDSVEGEVLQAAQLTVANLYDPAVPVRIRASGDGIQ